MLIWLSLFQHWLKSSHQKEGSRLHQVQLPWCWCSALRSEKEAKSFFFPLRFPSKPLDSQWRIPSIDIAASTSCNFSLFLKGQEEYLASSQLFFAPCTLWEIKRRWGRKEVMAQVCSSGFSNPSREAAAGTVGGIPSTFPVWIPHSPQAPETWYSNADH